MSRDRIKKEVLRVKGRIKEEIMIERSQRVLQEKKEREN